MYDLAILVRPLIRSGLWFSELLYNGLYWCQREVGNGGFARCAYKTCLNNGGAREIVRGISLLKHFHRGWEMKAGDRHFHHIVGANGIDILVPA